MGSWFRCQHDTGWIPQFSGNVEDCMMSGCLRSNPRNCLFGIADHLVLLA